jgi:hypothetical protein
MSNDLVGRPRTAAPSGGTSSDVGHAGTPGKRTLVEEAGTSPVQMRGGDAQPEAAVHAAASRGVATPATSLPFGDTLQRAFGRHDIASVQAHSGSEAAQTAKSMGAEAYAAGDHVVLGKTDLHTVAHEAAHVVQQRSGVQLKGGVGQTGDAYEQHADAVADKVVAGQSAESLLSTMAGTGGHTGAVQQQAVQFLGKPLDQPLDSTDPAPAHGETAGKQRKYSPDQYIEMWEKEQGRKLTDDEKATIARGCIGITANNLNGGGNPIDSAEKIYGTFDQAHAAMVERNATIDKLAAWPIINLFIDKTHYIVFAKMFWSNQDPDPKKRKNPDPNAFKPDPKTGEVDMSGYKYREQPGFVNFDYAFWDEASNSFWHANHMDYGDPSDPMIVLQSTKEKFAQGYRDFDRVVYCIARAHNYDPGLAAIAHAGSH